LKLSILIIAIVLLVGGVLLLGPVLVHTHMLNKPDYRSCGAFNEEGTGVILLNPFRLRAPEHVADTFLRAAARGGCSSETTVALCKTLKTHPLPSTEWRLVNRQDLPGHAVKLFYRDSKNQTACLMAMVHVAKAGVIWQVSGYGFSY
jgi:hypothetical protein